MNKLSKIKFLTHALITWGLLILANAVSAQNISPCTDLANWEGSLGTPWTPGTPFEILSPELNQTFTGNELKLEWSLPDEFVNATTEEDVLVDIRAFAGGDISQGGTAFFELDGAPYVASGLKGSQNDPFSPSSRFLPSSSFPNDTPLCMEARISNGVYTEWTYTVFQIDSCTVNGNCSPCAAGWNATMEDGTWYPNFSIQSPANGSVITSNTVSLDWERPPENEIETLVINVYQGGIKNELLSTSGAYTAGTLNDTEIDASLYASNTPICMDARIGNGEEFTQWQVTKFEVNPPGSESFMETPCQDNYTFGSNPPYWLSDPAFEITGPVSPVTGNAFNLSYAKPADGEISSFDFLVWVDGELHNLIHVIDEPYNSGLLDAGGPLSAIPTSAFPVGSSVCIEARINNGSSYSEWSYVDNLLIQPVEPECISQAVTTGTNESGESVSHVDVCETASSEQFLKDSSRQVGSPVHAEHPAGAMPSDNYIWTANTTDLGTNFFTLAEIFPSVAPDPSQASPLIDAHVNSGLVYDYLNNVLGINSIDNQGHDLRSTANVSLFPGDTYSYCGQEAAYDFFSNSVVFCKRPQSYAQAIDMVGHQWAHGLVSLYGGGLNYENESGAISESFSDWFGVALQAYTGDVNYTVAEKVDIERSLSKPSQYGQAEAYGQNFTHFKNVTNGDCEVYSGSVYGNSANDNCYVHANAGVGNKFFYLLTNGGDFRGYSNTGIDIDDAMKIAVASIKGLHNQATYQELRMVMEDWVSINMPIYVDEVETAWNSVGVGTQRYNLNILVISEELPNFDGGTITTRLEPSYPGNGSSVVADFVDTAPVSPYVAGDLLELQANLNPGWEFLGYEINGSGPYTYLNYALARLNTPQQSITSPNPVDINVTAIFQEERVNVAAALTSDSEELSGIVSFSGFGEYKLNELVTITVSNIPVDYEFIEWFGLDGVMITSETVSETEVSVTFMLLDNNDVNVQASFSLPLTVSSSNPDWGTAEILTSPPYQLGQTVAIKATPSGPPGPSSFSTYWQFVRWENLSNPAEDLSALQAEDFYTLTETTELVAVFEPRQFALRINSGIGRIVGIESDVVVAVNYDEEKTITALVDIGWTFDSWAGAISSADNPLTFGVEDVASDVGGLVEIDVNYARQTLSDCDHPTLIEVQVDEVPYGYGGCTASQIDNDGDGVYLNRDRCQGTPLGAVVDSKGCASGEVPMDLPEYDIAKVVFSGLESGVTFYPYEYMSPVVMDNGDLLQAFWFGNPKDEIRVYRIPPLVAGETVNINVGDDLFRIKSKRLVIFGIPIGPYNVRFEGMDNKYVYLTPSFWTGVIRCQFWDEGDPFNTEDDTYYPNDRCDHTVAYSVKQPNYWLDDELGDAWLFAHWINAPEIGSITHDYEKRITHITAQNTSTTEFHNVLVDLGSPQEFSRSNTKFQSGVFPSSFNLLNYWAYGFAGPRENPIVFGWDNMDPGAAASSIDFATGTAYDANFDMNMALLLQKDSGADGFYAVAANEQWVVGWTQKPGVIAAPFIEELAACRLSGSGFPVQDLSCSDWKIVPPLPNGMIGADNFTARLLLGDKSKLYAGPYEDYSEFASPQREDTALYILDLDAESFEKSQWVPVGALTPDLNPDTSDVEKTSEMISGVVADNGMLLVTERFEIDLSIPNAKVKGSRQASEYSLLMPIIYPDTSIPFDGSDFGDYVGTPGQDTVLAGEGNDTLSAETFGPSNSIEVIDGGDGYNVIVGSFNSVLDFSNTTLINIDSIDGSNGNDTIIGSNGDDTTNGNNGQDVLNGGAGNDTIDGGNGNDSITGGIGDDLLIGGKGDDTYHYSAGDGFDVIDNTGGGNDLLILEDIAFADVEFYTAGDDLIIDVLSSTGQIRLENWFFGLVMNVQDSLGEILTPAEINALAYNPAPEITSDPVTSVLVFESYSYSVIALDRNHDNLTYGLTVAPAGMDLTGNVLAWTPQVGDIGNHDVTIIVSDGNSVVEQSFVVTVEPLPLEITSLPPTLIQVNQSYEYLIQTNAIDEGLLTYQLTTKPVGMNIAANRIDWVPSPGQEGNHNVVVEVSDGQETVGQTFEIVVEAEPVPPMVVTTSPIDTGAEGQYYEYQVGIDNPAGGTVSAYLIESPFGMYVEGTTIKWAAEHVSAGKIPVALKITNGLESIEHYYVLKIDELNLPPRFTSWPTTLAFPGQTYEYLLSAEDPEGDPLSFSLVQPSNLTLIGNQLFWTPILGGQTESVTVEVSDGLNIVEQNFTLTVGNVGTPVIRSFAVKSVAPEGLYQYEVLAVDPEGDQLIYEVVDNGGARKLDFVGNVLTWQLGKNDSGSFNVEIKVSDNPDPLIANSDIQTFRITVGPPIVNTSSLPVISSVPTIDRAIYGRGYVYDYPVEASGAYGGEVSFEAVLRTPGLGQVFVIGNVIRYWPNVDPGWGNLEQVGITITVTDVELGTSTTQNWNLALSNYLGLPNITNSAPRKGVVDELYEHSISAQSLYASTLSYELGVHPEQMQLNANVVSWVPALSQLGNNSVELIARHDFHEPDTDVSRVVVNVTQSVNSKPVSTRFPILYSTGYGRQQTYTVLAEDPDGDDLSYTLVEGPSGAVLNGNVISWTPELADVGDHELFVFVSDGKSVYVDQINWSVIEEVNEAPVLSTLPFNFAVVDSKYEFTLELQDEDGPVNPAEASLVDGPNGLNLFGQTLTWWPSEGQVGEHHVILNLDDGYDNEYTFTITVYPLGVSPEIISEPPTHAVYSGLYEYVIEATDPGGLPLTYSLAASPDGMIISDKVITWTPDQNQEGFNNVTVHVSNGTISTQQNFTIEVTSPVPPIAYAGLDIVKNFGESITLDASGSSDADGSIISYEWFKEGVSIGSGVRLTIDNIEAGVHQLELVVTDNDGLQGSDIFSVTMSEANIPLVYISSPVNGSMYLTPSSIVLSAVAYDRDDSVSKVEFYEGENLIESDTTLPFEVVWNDVGEGDYIITARAYNSVGDFSTSDPISFSMLEDPTEENPLQISITSPVNGEGLNDNYVLVEGTFSGPQNSGIQVNGYQAAISGNIFYASIPLETGDNIITATLYTYNDLSVTRSIKINNFLPFTEFEINAGSNFGISPHEFSVIVKNKGEYGATIFWNGTDNFVLPPENELPLPVVIDEPGVYSLFVSVIGDNGDYIEREFKVVVVDESEVDQLLRQIWTDMTGALLAYRQEEGLKYFSFWSRKKYKDTFSVLSEKMPDIIPTFSGVKKSRITNEYGEYGVNRTINGEDQIFFIYFAKDGLGIWRVDSM